MQVKYGPQCMYKMVLNAHQNDTLKDKYGPLEVVYDPSVQAKKNGIQCR